MVYGLIADLSVLACLVLFSPQKMKTFFLIVLVVVAVAYYFGYEPSDLIPSFGAPAPVRHAHAPAEQPAPPRSSNTIIVATPDGSLDHRWKNLPSPSPTKP